MSSTWRMPLLLLTALAVAAASAGCGPALVKVKGRVLKDGEGLRGGGSLQVVFVPFVEGGGVPDDSYTANSLIDPPWGFEVLGKTGKGIPPGKYRIVVKEPLGTGGEDVLEGAFGPQNSPIIREILHSEDNLVIDLAKPEG